MTAPGGGARKRKRKVPVWVALGIWPQTSRWEVQDWELADKEDQPDWERLLVRLETRGVYAERGLQLILHDGGSGLLAALALIYPHVAHQRCVFHKLRNVWQAMAVPDDLDRHTARRLRTQIVHQAAAIYRAEDEWSARRRLREFRATWILLQPQVSPPSNAMSRIPCLSIALRRRFPSWRMESLRTTSVLERVNRKLRRCFRGAGAYHSRLGWAVATARVLTPYLAV